MIAENRGASYSFPHMYCFSMQDPLLIQAGIVQVEGELVSRKRLEELAPEQFSSILILADESATFSTADADQVSIPYQAWRPPSESQQAVTLSGHVLPLQIMPITVHLLHSARAGRCTEGLNACALLCMQASADSDSRNLATLLLLRDLQSKRMGSEAALRKTDGSDGRIRPSEPLPDQALALNNLCSEAGLLQR